MAPAFNTTVTPPCEKNYFWDNALDKCEPCNPYCADFELRDMKEECEKLCPEFVKQQTAALAEAENTLDSDSGGEFSQGLPTWVIVTIILTMFAVVLVFVVVSRVMMKRRRAGHCGLLAICGPKAPTQETKRPERVSNETGVDKLLPGGSDNVSIAVVEGEEPQE